MRRGRQLSASRSAAAVLGAALLLAAAAGAGEKPESPSVEQLRWMTGSWDGTSEVTVTEEHWMAPAGGLMLGMHREVRVSGDAFFEFLRIVERDGSLIYIAQPLGREPTEFRLREIGEGRVEFENLEHDYPQRIGYRLAADGSLTARIEGRVGGETRSSEWLWRKRE